MNKSLIKITEQIDSNKISLKDIAIFFEKYNGYSMIIETNSLELKVLFDKKALPHFLGLHHAFSRNKDLKKYRGISGFNMIKNEEITIPILKKALKNNTSTCISWKMIKRRIEFLPMFINTIEKTGRLKELDQNNIVRLSKLDGNYIVFRSAYENGKQILPLMLIKVINKDNVVFKTFIVEDSITLMGALYEFDECRIRIIPPPNNNYPISYIKYK